jgi:hypothetical protein
LWLFAETRGEYLFKFVSFAVQKQFEPLKIKSHSTLMHEKCFSQTMLDETLSLTHNFNQTSSPSGASN